MSSRKHFTLAEARRVLPIVTEELIRLQKLQKEFHQKLLLLRTLNADERFKLECNLEFLNIQAKLHARNITSQGALLKDVDLGLVDFPSSLDGEEILLCWKLGEKDIEYYHGLQEGFRGRKKIKPD
ncbi:hypothetical protein BEP19_04010 [Ammoniphilus oxalaticus]|uniref:Cell division protein DivIVA n=1 Tax=Ammoniphilus oxalaticus TaxID=66863 RepID=A0A419SLV9_9BACL|nr:DUF2203 domain-containing protein [Ammoniphilus oxalaticus]RKD25006.1 hypothetical protein BEP19_04010 [Ammoniphilus oxalaticus]